MPKDPKRNLQRYQLQGGHLNEFEFQKSQNEMAEEPELPFTDESEPNLIQAKRVAEVTAEAHRIVKKRKKRGVAKTEGRSNIATHKRSAKKVARKSPKKTTKRAGASKRTSTKSRSKKSAASRDKGPGSTKR